MLKNNNNKKKVANAKDANVINRLNLTMNHQESNEALSKSKTRNFSNLTTDVIVAAVRTENKASNKMVSISVSSKRIRNDSIISNKTLKSDYSIRILKDFNHKINFSRLMSSLSREKKLNYLQINQSTLINQQTRNNTIIKSKLNSNQIANHITRNFKKISENITSTLNIFEMKTIPELNQTSKMNPIRIKPFNDSSIKDCTKIPYQKHMNSILNTLIKTVKCPVAKNTSSKTVVIKEKENNISVYKKNTVNVNKSNNVNKQNTNDDKLALKDKIKTMTLNLKNPNKNSTNNFNKNTILNTITNGKPNANLTLPNKINKNLNSVKSLQTLPALNKNKKLDSKKANEFQSSFSIYMKTTLVKPIPNKNGVKPPTHMTRSFDQFNMMNLNNLSKIIKSTKNIFDPKLRKNTSEINIGNKSSFKNPLQNQIEIINTSKLTSHDKHNSISNCSLGSFSLIHEKSEQNSVTKQQELNDFKLNVEAIDYDNNAAFEFKEYKDPSQQIEEEDANVNEDNNDNIDDGEEGEAESGALTLDQVKDIIVFFDFNEFDVEDKSLFYENDDQEFEENSKLKYKKYFFAKNQNNSVIDDAYNISPSTKDSSSYRNIYITSDIK